MEPQRVFVVGMGEVGRRLGTALERVGWQVRPVTRDEGWDSALDAGDPAPRILAVREEAFADVFGRFPPPLRERLVLVQNGFLEAVHGELGPVTRGLIYFTSKGDFFEVLCPSPFYGPLAERLAPALAEGGLRAEMIADRAESLRAMIVKGLWNAVVGLPLAVHGVDLATYRERHAEELRELIVEGTRAAGAEYGVEVDAEATLVKILESTAALGWVRGGKKALPWRNGALSWFGRRHGLATPVNDLLLRAVDYDPEVDPRDAT